MRLLNLKEMTTFDITVIINAHNEGSLAHHSCLSIREAIDFAELYEIRVEAIAILDNPNQETVDYFTESNHKWLKVIHVNYKDIGLSRNYGVSTANGKHIAFLDADDLWSYNWLYEAYTFCKNEKTDIICHPELNFYFGENAYIFLHEDSTSSEFNKWKLVKHNYWTSLVFLQKKLYLEQIQINTNLSSGWGYEDWHWHCETLANGIHHRVVPNTAHFIRVKQDGQLISSGQNRCILPSTKLFDPDFFNQK